VTGLSRSIEAEAPEAALRLNPLNTDARVAWLVAELNASQPSSSLEQQRELTRTGLAFSPADARLHSLAAELERRAGNGDEAERLFLQANRISHTEILALQHLIAAAIERGDYASAVERLDLLLRRWPDRLNVVMPVLPALLSQEDAYQTILAAMKAGAPWRWGLVSGLTRQPEGLDFAYRVLMDLAATPEPPTRNEISAAVRAFMSAKRYDEGYRLFRFTVPEEERHLSGFVHNSVFQADALDAPPFSWQRRNTRAAEIRFSADPSSHGAAVRFLDAPAKDLVLNQSLVLPQGKYRLFAEADASGLRAPRTLFWRVRCAENGKELARLRIPEGSYKERELELTFDTGPCALQRIELATDVIAESWQNRYSGNVRFHFVRIERAEPHATDG